MLRVLHTAFNIPQQRFNITCVTLPIFSPETKTPLYYRMLAGDIRETKALKMTVEESRLKEAMVIEEKGFHSAENLKNLQNEQLDYILPLRRRHRLCEYGVVEKGNKKEFDGFLFLRSVLFGIKNMKKKDINCFYF